MATENFVDEDGTLSIPDDWWEIAREILTSEGGDIREDVPVKMEIRYVHRNKYGYETKYRLVAYEGDVDVTIPPPRRDTTSLNSVPLKIEAPVIQCLMVPNETRDTDDQPRRHVDLTTRLLKYMGPNGDFGFTGMKAYEMYPFDDPEQLMDSFCGMQVDNIFSRTTFDMDEEIC